MTSPADGIIATLASVSVAVAIAFFKAVGLEFLWTAPCSLAAGMLAGMIPDILSGFGVRTTWPD